MNKKSKSSLDPSIAKYYSDGKEKDRLSEHRLEKDRTLMILRKFLPSSPATILDIGGASGVYAFPLASMGYDVHLVDPISIHIKQALEFEASSSIKLGSCTLGDARQVEKAHHFADVVLLFGPLYHLFEEKDRLKALQEAYRLLKPGGKLFAVGISRFASFMDSVNDGLFHDKVDVIERAFSTGVHHKRSAGLDFIYLHRPSELKEEIQRCGFQDISLRAIEGPVWHKGLIDIVLQSPNGWEHLLKTIEKIEEEETIVGASAHMMAIATKQ